MNKTYTIECGSSASGTTYTVLVKGEPKNSRYFSTKVKKSKEFPNGKKISARDQLEEYVAYLEERGYEREYTQTEKDLSTFMALGGDFDNFVKNMPKK